MPALTLACRVVVSPSHNSAGIASRVAARLEPSIETVTSACALQSPCGLVTVTVKVVVSVSPTVVVFCALGLATLLAGSQWKVNEPVTPAWALRFELPPYWTTIGEADAVGEGEA